MVTKRQLTSAEKEHWQHTDNLVNNWARVHVPDEYNYNSRATYWRSALTAGIIDESMYKLAQERYGDLWWYVGD